jgi:lipopolysaccharide/colanic/teichoic acid biosynthesis glycosyltransferase
MDVGGWSTGTPGTNETARTPSPPRRGGAQRVVERALDITLTLIALPVVLLVAAVIALAIFIDSPGPVIYRSRRIGRSGRPFDMLKFRKMRREAPSGPVTLEDDERFTPIGRFLAATRLDELPQVINVLRGEMRLVGPRPELECFVHEFRDAYAEVLTVTPGLTGEAQLEFVGERALLKGPHPERIYSEHVLPLKIQIDLEYVRSHTLASDLGILVRTVVLPARLLVARVWARRAVIWLWIPSALGALALGATFVLVSSHLP